MNQKLYISTRTAPIVDIRPFINSSRPIIDQRDKRQVIIDAWLENQADMTFNRRDIALADSLS